MMQATDPSEVATGWALGGGEVVDPAPASALDGRQATIKRWREYIEKH